MQSEIDALQQEKVYLQGQVAQRQQELDRTAQRNDELIELAMSTQKLVAELTKQVIDLKLLAAPVVKQQRKGGLLQRIFGKKKDRS